MILIIGAAGITGQAVIKSLARKGAPVRGLAYNEAEALTIKAAGATEAVLGDMRDRQSLKNAMQGVQALYHICPRMKEDETDIGKNVIAAAEASGVALFGLHSCIHPELEDIHFHWAKMLVEEALIKSSLQYFIMQPTNYMQNIVWTWQQVTEEGIYSLPYSADSRLTWLDVEDLGEAVANILTEPGHIGATYEIGGPDGALTRHQICEIASRVLGRPIRAEAEPVDDYIARPRFKDRDPVEMQRLKTMFLFYDRYGLTCGNHHILEMLLKRKATGYEACIRRIVESGWKWER